MKTVVKRSRIHGKGLFAAKFIPAGETIGQCTVSPVDSDSEPDCYTLFLDEGENIRVNVTCNFRYINHSDEPNVAYCDDLTVVALESITRGSELTHNYDGD